MPQVYNAEPCYPPENCAVGAGYRAAAALLSEGCVLAVDGPAAVDWDGFAAGLGEALAGRGGPIALVDLREHFAAWPDILSRTASLQLADDPHFATLSQAGLSEFFDALPLVEPTPDGFTVVYGPGAALVGHDALWYADLPKRFAETAIGAGTGRNLGQPDATGPGTARRLFYIDWPVLDRHRDAIAAEVDVWIDTQVPGEPQWLDGTGLRATLAALARRPFRTRPTFNTTSWGGHWAQKQLGMDPDAPNTALGYELIAPESGVLIGEPGGPRVEVPFQLLVALHPEPVLGTRVHAMFGTSFPIRFDYLDTFGGGNLSVHCHPQTDYMRRVFGWPYTQHETYYIMVGGPDRKVFLGLREDVDLAGFRRDADHAVHDGVAFDIERHVQTFPADPHQLFLIPAGTPHGSGEGNVVLEISATPYLYSLRFYDWLRKDAAGGQRPVHVARAFDNLDTERRGQQVRNGLVQQPRMLRSGEGWHEELIGALPEMFFEVHRIRLDEDAAAPDDTHDHFHVLNVVEGEAVLVETDDGQHHTLAYAETLTIPAAVGGYRVCNLGSAPTRYVKAVIR